MELKRNVHRITNWSFLEKWTKFHDLELYKISKTSTLTVFAVLLIDLVQRLSLVTIKFPLKTDLNRIHRKFYGEVVQIVSMRSTIDAYKSQFSIIIGVYMLVKFILTCYFLYVAQREEVRRSTAAWYLRSLEFLKFLDVTILLIPITKDSFFNFVNRDLALSAISFGSLVLLMLEFAYLNFFSIDIRFIKVNLFQGRDRTMNLIRFFGTIVIIFFKVLDSKFFDSASFVTFINFLNFSLGIWLVLDLNYKLHFVQLSIIRYTYLVTNLVYAVESIFAVFFFFYPEFIKNFDLDYVMIVIFMLIVNFCRLYLQNKEDKLGRTYVYGIDSILEADQYMENMACLFKKTMNKSFKLQLFSLLKLHFEKCKDVRCLCFLLKFPINKTTERRLVDQLTKSQKDKNNLKLILYDDVVAMNILREEFKGKADKAEMWQSVPEAANADSDLGEGSDKPCEHTKGLYVVNLKSNDLPTVFASFYHILLAKFKRRDSFLLFKSYLSFLVFEVNNYVGSLINSYNYLFSPDYRKRSGLLKNITLMNYIDLSSKRLHKEFLDSPYWLSNERLYGIFEFSKRLDKLERNFAELIRMNVDFYQEICGSTINFSFLVDIGKKIHDLKEEMENEFYRLSQITKDNTKLISLYINYMLNVNFERDETLSECYEKLHYLYKTDIYKSLKELASKNQPMNLYSSKSMLVFINILQSKFYISKFSSNMPSFFGYDSKELTGKSLSDLMPNEISKDHDRYVLDYVNQKKNPIIKTASLTSFAITKSGDLKLVSVLVKVEYMITDDVYLCGIIVPHPKNREVLILSNLSGKIIAINKKAKKMLGTMILDNPYSLFISIPLLVKYFYPEIEKQLRYSKFSLRKNKKNIIDEDDRELGMNFELETEEFGAFFFKYLLQEKTKFKGILQESRTGILKNFGFDDLKQWNILKEITSKMLLPKHIRILSRVIAKNRQLMASHTDEILTTFVSIDTYKHRGNLTFKLIGLSEISNTNQKVKKFFVHAAQNLKGEMADVFLVAPKDINNLYKILRVERLIKMSTMSDSKKSYLIENSQIEEASYSPDKLKEIEFMREKVTGQQVNSEKSHRKRPAYVKKKSAFNKTLDKVNFNPSQRKKEPKIAREEDVIGDIGDDRREVNPADYYFDKNFVMDEGKVTGEKEELENDGKTGLFKKPKWSVGPRGSTLNRSHHKRVTYMSKKDTVVEPIQFEEADEIEEARLKQIYGTKNLDSEKKNMKIEVNGPLSPSAKSEIEHSDENIPNFKFISRQKSVESRLKYLSEVYTELIKTSKAQEFLKSVKMVMNIEKLREIEADGDKFNSLRDTEEQMRDLIIKIDAEDVSENRMEMNEGKEGTKRNEGEMVTNTGGERMMRSSIASYQSKVLTQNSIRANIEKAVREIFSRPLQAIKLFIFFLLIIFTVIIRLQINSSIDSHEARIVSFKEYGKAVKPIGYLYKELTKYKLFLNGYLHESHLVGKELFNIMVMEEMSGDLIDHFSYLSSSDILGITSKVHGFDIRGEDFEQDKDLSFFTLYVHVVRDYQNIMKNYNPYEPKLISDTHRFELESSLANTFEMIYESSSSLQGMLESSQFLEDEYAIYYLIFLICNVLLTIIIGNILIILNIRANNKINIMANLLLRIDKEKLAIFLEKFQRVQASIKLISKKKIRGVDQKELRKTLRMKKKTKPGETRRKNFSTFVSKYHSSNLLVCTIIFSTMIFVNIPIAIDYYFITEIVKDAGSLNTISVYSNLLATDAYSYYGMFYHRLYSKYKGKELTKNTITVDDKLNDLFNKREALQNLISGYPVFDDVQKKSICQYAALGNQNLTQECQSVTGSQSNYNIFLAMSDISNFYSRSMATITESENPQISTNNLLKFDLSLYFISKNLDKMMTVANEQILVNLSSKKLILALFFTLFGFFMIVYYTIYRHFLISSKKAVMRKLGCSYLVLPSEVIGSNSYLINFFHLRRQFGYM